MCTLARRSAMLEVANTLCMYHETKPKGCVHFLGTWSCWERRLLRRLKFVITLLHVAVAAFTSHVCSSHCQNWAGRGGGGKERKCGDAFVKPLGCSDSIILVDACIDSTCSLQCVTSASQLHFLACYNNMPHNCYILITFLLIFFSSSSPSIPPPSSSRCQPVCHHYAVFWGLSSCHHLTHSLRPYLLHWMDFNSNVSKKYSWLSVTIQELLYIYIPPCLYP